MCVDACVCCMLYVVCVCARDVYVCVCVCVHEPLMMIHMYWLSKLCRGIMKVKSFESFFFSWFVTLAVSAYF